MTKAVAELSSCLRITSILLSKVGGGNKLSLRTQSSQIPFLGAFALSSPFLTSVLLCVVRWAVNVAAL